MAYNKCTERKRDTDTWLRESFKQEEEEDGNVDMKEETKKIIGNTESPELGKQYVHAHDCTVLDTNWFF